MSTTEAQRMVVCKDLIDWESRTVLNLRQNEITKTTFDLSLYTKPVWIGLTRVFLSAPRYD